MCFWRKEKKEEVIKQKEYYVPFDCSNCHCPGMVTWIPQGIRITEYIDEVDQKLIRCGRCGCYTSRKDGIKIAEK